MSGFLYPRPVLLGGHYCDLCSFEGPGPVFEYSSGTSADFTVTHVAAIGFIYGHRRDPKVKRELLETFRSVAVSHFSKVFVKLFLALPSERKRNVS
jgi:hypothetical protein